MLSHVAERVLHELTLARMALNGELPAEKLPAIPEARDEGERRRLTALALINRLGNLLADVADVAEIADRTLYEMVEGVELSGQLPVTEEKKVFGFAAARKAA
jgi:hypothetical protein